MPRLSDDAYQRFESYLGSGKADEVAEQVRNGEMSASEAEEWSVQLEEDSERSRGRSDIDPEDWRDFEDGWRP